MGSPPVLGPVLACGPVDAETAVVTVGRLAADGELEDLERRVVDGDSEVCVTDTDAGVPPVGVGVVHTDAEGRSREAAELARVEGRLTTRIEARDVTATTREVTTLGPLGATSVERRVGVPQLVRVAVSYPRTWNVTVPDGDGIATTVVDGVVEVSRSAVLFPPLLDDAVALEIQATPGRGTPSLSVEATPLAGAAPVPVPAGVLEQDALAVIGALAEVGEDGADALADGAGELAEGVDELAGGTGELADGADDLFRGLTGLSGGVDELAGGAGELSDGATDLAEGTRGLAGGLAESAQGSAALAAGAGELGAGTAELAAGAAELAVGAQELATGAEELAAGLAGDEGAPPPDLDASEVSGGLEEIAVGIAGVRDGLTAQVPPGAGPDDPLAVAVGTLTVLGDATRDLKAELFEGLTAVGAALKGLEEAAGGAAALAEGAGELSAGAAALADAIDSLTEGAGELAAGTAELAGGLDELAAASGAISDGAGGLATGTAGLAEGSRELADGSRELAGGGRGLAEGTAELADGTSELAEGSAELAEGAAELPGALAELVAVADRSGQDAATTLAVLDAGDALARDHVGDAALRTWQLRHAGEAPLPVVAAAGTAAAVLVVLVGLFGLLRRRWGRG